MHKIRYSSVLPLEIRDRIYRQLLGDRVIHIKVITYVPPHERPELQQRSELWWIMESLYREHLSNIGVICFKCNSNSGEDYWSHAVCQVPETIDQDYRVFQTNRSVDQEQYSSHSDCNKAVRDCKCIALK